MAMTEKKKGHGLGNLKGGQIKSSPGMMSLSELAKFGRIGVCQQKI